MRPDFITELRDLINRRSMENASNTPDFILAEYLTNCLRAWNQASQQRETWYGRAGKLKSQRDAWDMKRKTLRALRKAKSPNAGSEAPPTSDVRKSKTL